MEKARCAVTNVLRTVGRTPLVRLEAFERPGGPRLFAKCEFLGPGSSIFDRAAAAELAHADRAGHLTEGHGLVAAGGTDASISLAMAASALGQPLKLFVPRSLGFERKKAFVDYGARLEAVDDDLGFEAASERALDFAKSSRALYVDLFEGETVVAAYEVVAKEIVEALGGAPALTLCGLDRGAIATGLARALGPAKVVAVEPANARIGSGGGWAPHLFGGLAPSPEPVALDRALVTEFEPVDEREAWTASDELARRAGLLAGIVSGAMLVAARRRISSLGEGEALVVVLPDSGERKFALAPFFA